MMMRAALLGVVFLFSVSAFAATQATKEYVDRNVAAASSNAVRYVDASTNALSSAVGRQIADMATGAGMTNAVRSIVTNEVTVGFTDWTYDAQNEFGRIERVKSVQSMDWLESGDIFDCSFPTWRCNATIEYVGEDGEWHEYSSTFCSGFAYFDVDKNSESVVMATGRTWDVRIVATRSPIRVNSLGLATAKDVVSAEAVTNIARDVSNTFWDERNSVLWRLDFRDGEPMFLPVTNENAKVGGAL